MKIGLNRYVLRLSQYLNSAHTLKQKRKFRRQVTLEWLEARTLAECINHQARA